LIHENQLVDALLFIGILAPSVILHEIAHGAVALRLGDPTARDAGRLTLNPVRHIDPFGSLLLPGLLALARQPVFGWAKPVPVEPRYFERPVSGMAITALFGPATNLAIAAILVRFAPIVEQGGQLYRTSEGIGGRVLIAAVTVNVALAVFNMLPIPPLDGSRLLPLVLTPRGRQVYARVSQYGFLILFVLIFVFDNALSFLSDWIFWIVRVLV
jgi:Zn-dependent protease